MGRFTANSAGRIDRKILQFTRDKCNFGSRLPRSFLPLIAMPSEGDEAEKVSLDSLRELLERGIGLPPHPVLEKSISKATRMAWNVRKDRRLGELFLCWTSMNWKKLKLIPIWISIFINFLSKSRPRLPLPSADIVIKEVALLPTYLPSVATLKEAPKKTRDWNSSLEVWQKLEYSPYLEAFESLMSKAKPIAIRLDLPDKLENQIAAAHTWRERNATKFLRKNSNYSRIKVLSPRLDVLGLDFTEYQTTFFYFTKKIFKISCITFPTPSTQRRNLQPNQRDSRNHPWGRKEERSSTDRWRFQKEWKQRIN